MSDLDWSRLADRMAMVRLLSTGELRGGRRLAGVVAHALELGWAQQTTRAAVVALTECGARDVEALLCRVWPGWRAARAALEAADLPLDPRGLRTWRDRVRIARGPSLPERANRRTVAAAVAEHTKVRLSAEQRAAAEGVETTRDGVVRLRAPTGMVLRVGQAELALRGWMEAVGEVALPERAIDALQVVRGPRAVLTVENLGAFVDLPAPEGVCVVYVPGWDTRLAVRLLRGLGPARVLHFGDLDPAGVEILAHLRRALGAVGWFVPSCWQPYAATHALRSDSPWPTLPADAPDWVGSELAAADRWLEQEPLLLDDALGPALAAAFELA